MAQTKPSSWLRPLLDVLRRPPAPLLVESPVAKVQSSAGPFVIDDETAFHSTTLRRVWSLLEQKRGSRPFLARRDIDPGELVFTLPFVALIEVHGDPPRFRYRLAGTGYREMFGFELTGTWLEAWPDPVQGALYTTTTRLAFETRRAIVARRSVMVGGRALPYETMLTPLSEDGETVTMILLILAPATELRPSGERS